MSETAKQTAVAVTREEAPPPAAAMSEAAAIFHVIERAAMNPAVDIEKMERLLQMQERVMARNAKAAYAEAFAAMQPELPIVDKRGRIEIRAKNDDTKVIQSTPYALWEDINEAIRPVMAQHGFGLSFRTGVASDGKITVTGVLAHREGHSEETMMTLAHDSTGSKNAVQAVGSSLSYGKRYTAGLLLNFTSRGEDDDGEAAEAEGTISEEQAANIRVIAEEVGADIPKFCRFLKVESIPELPARRYQEALKALQAKRVRK